MEAMDAGRSKNPDLAAGAGFQGRGLLSAALGLEPCSATRDSHGNDATENRAQGHFASAEGDR